MELIDYLELVKMNDQSQNLRARLLCYYCYKEYEQYSFSMSLIADMFEKCGYCKPNLSRLKDNLIKGKDKCFVGSKEHKGELVFVQVTLQQLERQYGNAWNDYESIDSYSEFLDEIKFCGKRQFLDRLIKQINNTYKNNCYDACAVILRRLFEVVLVMAYQNLGIDAQIKTPDGKGYKMLDSIVSDAFNNPTLKLSRIKTEFDTIRKVGNFSAHSITYIAGKKDIDDIKLAYRVMLEELYNKAGLMEEM